VSRSSLSDHPVAPSPRQVTLKHRIDEIYTANPFYGSRRDPKGTPAQLRREELVVNRKAVQRHMREMGIEAIGPRPNLSKPHPVHRVFPYLLGDVVASFPDHVWGIEIVCTQMTKA
jgi:putative transposase